MFTLPGHTGNPFDLADNADQHAKFFRPSAVSAGGSAANATDGGYEVNNLSNCAPFNGGRCAAGTAASNSAIAATFSYN